ncbi:hypothetical protein N4P33_26070 [Streptomyces sp. 15-116A]|uniref:hypothetical protein n=1 Tax=Streptomyces sp. 15-116A TaxID=2259035 RepID=UPI0021B3712C|nr:hypothetical protein [Streptomyces sp. 15-116A]MCT7355596.1 hypothetical protein [Streptomyces sp. 15-116A]
MPRHAGGRARTSRKARLLALAGVVLTGAVVLPLALAAADPGGSRGASGMKRAGEEPAHSSGRERATVPGDSAHPARPSTRDDGRAPTPAESAEATGSPLPPGGLHLSTAVRCGPELTSPDGIEAQTCVVAQGEDVWARTYYRNATGDTLHAVLALLGPGGRSVRMPCAADAGDELAICETPRQRRRADLAGYMAVAEFSQRAGQGPLLLRSGSNSQSGTSS